MGKALKKTITGILLVLVIGASFVAGDYFEPNIASRVGFHPQFGSHSSGEPYTADEVTDVGIVKPFDDTGSGTIAIAQQQFPYVIDVDFSPVLLKEAQFEKKLIIMTQHATASEKAKKAGLFNLPVFKQTKAIIFHGEGTYSVDLTSLSSSDFVIDKEEKSITIMIPRPQLTVSLLPEKTEFFDSSNGILRFGEMEISPEAMTTLQTQGKAKILEILQNDQNTWNTAIKFAKLSVKEIYEPIVSAQIDAAVQNADDEFAIPPVYTINVEIKDE